MAFTAYAVTAPGLETLAAAELDGLGIAHADAARGGVEFSATDLTLARALLNLRTATRVLVRVAEFRATSFAQLEQRSKAISWAAWVAPGGRVQFRVTCRKSRLYHSDAVAQRISGALAGAVRGVVIEKSASTPDDDGTIEDAHVQLFVVRMADNMCTISIDAAGAPLYQRGYRKAVAKAPLRETLAAAMLLGANWNPRTALYDPMCGSGTLVIEAALLARGIAPGLHRAFAAERWPRATAAVWTDVRATATAAIIARAPTPLVGSDRDEGAIVAARANAERAGVANDAAFCVAPVSAAQSAEREGLLITNPPYGHRIGDTHDLRDLYTRFGQVAREQFPGWRCAVLSADATRGHSLERHIGLEFTEAWRSSNGGIPVRLLVAVQMAARRTMSR